MGIFSSRHSTNSDMKSTSGNYHLGEDESKSQTSSSSNKSTSSEIHSDTSSQKSACGCGCAHRAKPVDEEVLEVKEEWDF